MMGKPSTYWREELSSSRTKRKQRVPGCDKGIVASTVALLKSCANKKDLNKGIQVHNYILEKGLLGKSLYIGNSLVNMYAKCGSLEKAERIFLELPFKDVVSWNALISGYVQCGHAQSAFRCFTLMQKYCICPNVVTYTSVLKACGDMEDLALGIKIHDAIVDNGFFEKDIVVGNALIDMYAKCGMILKAHQVLDDMPFRETVSWNALITGYMKHGKGKEAWLLSNQMQIEGLLPDIITFTCALKACGCTGALVQGKRIHHVIISEGILDKSIELGNSLVDMYAKCGDLMKAQGVLTELSFRNVVTWNTLITGYILQGLCEEAFHSFKQMQSEGITPDAITFMCMLKSCGCVSAIERGIEIHDEISNNGLLRRNIFLGNALIDMYVKCCALGRAQEVLDQMNIRNVVSWSAMITGYTQHGQSETALVCFGRMQYDDGIRPNAVTLSCILKACGNIGLLEKGKEIHDEMVCCGWLVNDTVLSNALVDMYAKCGALEKAQYVFHHLSVQDETSWSVLITGYAHHGLAEEVLSLFQEMQNNGFSPNSSIFLSLLSSCSHSGLLDEGHAYFEHMRRSHKIIANVEHYTCMVDLFARAGCYNEALLMLKKMPTFDYLPIWNILLGACQKLGILNLGKVAFEQAVELDSRNAEAYVYMANIHAIAVVQANMNEL